MGLVIYYVLLSWMPTLMLGMGYPLAESAWLTSLFTFGGTAGILLAAGMMDRWEAHKVVMTGFARTRLFALALGFLGVECQLQHPAGVPILAALQVLQLAAGVAETGHDHL